MTGYDPIPVGRISRTNANEFDISDGLFRAPQHPSSHCPPRYLGGGSSWAVARPVFDAVMSTPTPVGGPSASTPLKMSTAIEAVEVSALPYAFFSPLAQLLAAQGDEAGLDGLLVGRRYDLSAISVLATASARRSWHGLPRSRRNRAAWASFCASARRPPSSWYPSSCFG